MAGERYVLLGLGTTRSPWFTDVARWATVGSLPAEFVKCISAEELRVRLTGGRPFSAVLVDAGSGAVDRDLVDVATRHHATVLVVADGDPAPWLALGAAAVLGPSLTREGLLDALAGHCRLVGGAVELPLDRDPSSVAALDAGPLVAVTGAGGAGTSTVALALAQGLAGGQPADERPVLLADLCLDAEQAVLHDARDVVPGLQELLDAHRRGRPGPTEVRRLTFDVVHRGYSLLLGLRRHRDWTVLRPRSFEAALEGLRTAFGVVVADIDPDLEGEAECGSVEVEERNVMARTVAGRADVVLVVGTPGVKGVHGLVRTVDRLRAHGVDGGRILTVLNRSARHPRGRAELTRTVADLTGAEGSVVGPLHLPERRGLDDLLRDGAPLPASLTQPLAGAVTGLLAGAERGTPVAGPEPVPVTPGSLGAWTDQELAG